MSMLYTIVPVEVVFADEREEEEKAVKEIAVAIDGVTLLVEPDGLGRGKVNRIISTDPQHYLDPRWQPGATVRW